MATAYEKIRQRKIIYLAAIVVLLGASWVHRTMVIEAAATRYDLTETNLGKVDLGGSLSRFVLSSFRGPLVCGLWWDAIDQQKKHDFNQLEMLIKALVRLQPHFKGPWKYQGWNLAYNVSVEFDRAQDKYFYISKGIRWLADGEERNRMQLWDESKKQMRPVGDPAMRQEVAQYLYNKMYYADEHMIFRPFLHLSCIPRSNRDPVRLRNNPTLLADFKRQHKRFVRRVRDYYSLPDGDEASLNTFLLNFLEEHRDVPTLWKETGTAVAVAEDPWPRWPNMTDTDFLSRVQDKEDQQDGVDISRIWYEFSVEPLPPPQTELDKDVSPRSSRFYRTPTNMHSMIFRANPVRSWCLMGQELDKEGWTEEAGEAWQKGYAAWLQLGRSCNIDQSPEMYEEMKVKEAYYQAKYRDLAESQSPPPDFLREQNPEEYKRAYDSFRAVIFLNNFKKLRDVCRYDHWLHTSYASMQPSFRGAMKAKYLASRRPTDWPAARDHYERAIGLMQIGFRKPLAPEYELGLRLTMLTPSLSSAMAQVAPPVSMQLSTYGMDETTQEGMLELQDQYLRIVAKQRAPQELRYQQGTWNLREMLMSFGQPATAPVAGMPPGVFVPPSPLHIGFVEDVIENGRGPFDDFISPALRSEATYEKKLGKR
jgi:hypothetical protein